MQPRAGAPIEPDARRFAAPAAVALAAVAVALGSMWIASHAEPVPRLRVPGPGAVEGFSWVRAGVGAWTWIAAGLATPVFFLLAERFPFERGRFSASLALHFALVAGLGYGASTAFHSYVVGRFLAPPAGALELVAWSLPPCVVVAVVHALSATRRGRVRELEAARLRAQLAESRVQALAAKLDPHFLFNTLQGISTLIHRRPEAADRMLSSLAALLRESLARGDRLTHALADELAALEPYLEIARLRFGDRLRFEREVADDVLGAEVPYFALQPLVENAIEHGLARREGAGTVVVYARGDGRELRLGVRDDGPGLAGAAPAEGLGLSLTRQRLRELYGAAGRLELRPNAPRGLCAEVSIPLGAARGSEGRP